MKTFSFDNSIEKREVENIGHKITITVGDITDDIMPLFEKSVEGDIKAKLEMYRKIYDRQAKERIEPMNIHPPKQGDRNNKL
jgi:hypothetical protein